jgi:hypothetical protein
MDLDPRIQITGLWILIRKWLTRWQQNISFYYKFFLLIHQSSKIKRSHKIVKSRFFLLFLHNDGFYGMLISMSCLFYGWEVVGGWVRKYFWCLFASLFTFDSFRFHFFRCLECFACMRTKRKKKFFFRFKAKTKIPTFSLIFALSEYERRTLLHAPSFCIHFQHMLVR